MTLEEKVKIQEKGLERLRLLVGAIHILLKNSRTLNLINFYECIAEIDHIIATTLMETQEKEKEE